MCDFNLLRSLFSSHRNLNITASFRTCKSLPKTVIHRIFLIRTSIDQVGKILCAVNSKKCDIFRTRPPIKKSRAPSTSAQKVTLRVVTTKVALTHVAPARRETGNTRRWTPTRERRRLSLRELHPWIALGQIFHQDLLPTPRRHFRPARWRPKFVESHLHRRNAAYTPRTSSLGLPVRYKRQWASAAPSVLTPGVISY